MSTQLTQGQRVCFTGTMRKSRQDMHALATRESLRPTDNAKDADVLVIGDRDFNSTRRTTKRATAERRGIPVISESTFFAQLGQAQAQPATSAAPDKPIRRAMSPNALLKRWKPTRGSGSVNF